jgi:hypothetical protein
VASALWVAARQRDQVGVAVFVEKKVPQVKGMSDLEIGTFAPFAVSAFGGNLFQDVVAVDGDQADQLGAHHRFVRHR